MKALYESILDDEEILISDVKNTINDPFATIVAAIDSGMNENELAKFIASGIFDKFIDNELYLNSKDLDWEVMTFNDSIVSISLCHSNSKTLVVVIRYRKKSRILDLEIHKFSSWGSIRDIFEYDKYKKTLSNIRKRGFKKSNWSLDKMGNFNVYNKKV
jgi:hypothetical protein